MAAATAKAVALLITLVLQAGRVVRCSAKEPHPVGKVEKWNPKSSPPRVMGMTACCYANAHAAHGWRLAAAPGWLPARRAHTRPHTPSGEGRTEAPKWHRFGELRRSGRHADGTLRCL